MAFAKRINELGYEVRPRTTDEVAEQRIELVRRTDRTDLEKMEALGSVSDTAANRPCPTRKRPTASTALFRDRTIDIQTGELLGRYIGEERDTVRTLSAVLRRALRIARRRRRRRAASPRGASPTSRRRSTRCARGSRSCARSSARRRCPPAKRVSRPRAATRPIVRAEEAEEADMVNLPTATLGRTGLEVTKLGYGAMELRGEPAVPPWSDRRRGRVLNAVLDAGINFIDTSPDYGRSRGAHRRAHLASARRVLPREQVRLPGRPAAPRGRRPDARVHTARTSAPAWSRASGACSTDHLDLVQFHISPSRDDARGRTARSRRCWRCATRARSRFVGMSGTLPNLDDHIEMGVFDAFQIPYSALEREHEDVITRRRRRGCRHHHPRRCGAGRAGRAGRRSPSTRAWSASDRARGSRGSEPSSTTCSTA